MRKVTWMNVNGDQTRVEVVAKNPTFEAMQAFVGGYVEHVTVLSNGKRASMYVNDSGMIDCLPVNDQATVLYRNAAQSRGVSNPYSIHGPAILIEGFKEKN